MTNLVAIPVFATTIRPMEGPSGYAQFSACGKYRYSLTRRWGEGPTATFIMLNPSTADATTNDHTIRKCIGFARAWNCGELKVVNLFAFRATLPQDLFRARDPVGPQNHSAFNRAMRSANRDIGPVVCAWGTHGAWSNQNLNILKWLNSWPAIRPLCLGVTRNGQPKHPLYISYQTKLVELRQSTRP